jgi:tripartite-type tricarboxylate transporter receptor subunit TctC
LGYVGRIDASVVRLSGRYTRSMQERRSFMPTRRGILAGAASLACVPLGHAALAEVVRKPVHIIVGFPAGGGTDVIARLVAEQLRGPYAATLLVENKPGAAARIAVDLVKTAEADGSVMLFTPDFPITLYPSSFRSLSYDPLRDLTAVAPAAKSMLAYSIGPAVPEHVKTLADYVQWCRDNPEKASYATTAAGGTPHFVGVMLAGAAGIRLTPVHYRGGAPALQDLLGGHVPASVNPVSETLPFVHSGTLRILAVTGASRSPFLPDIPTMREQGYDIRVESWLGLFVPARTPADVVAALNAIIGTIVGSPEMRASLAKAGNEPAYQTPDAFAAAVKADIERWRPVVKASGFVAED